LVGPEAILGCRNPEGRAAIAPTDRVVEIIDALEPKKREESRIEEPRALEVDDTYDDMVQCDDSCHSLRLCFN
jgi:hypothetical protein